MRFPTRARRSAPRALTLIEMLIGMAITLVMMAAVVNLFANIGAGVRLRRAGMEMNGQLRVTRARLYKDLAGATCEARPKLPSDDHSDGYIEIIEGQYTDSKPSLLTDLTDNGITSTNPELDYTSSLVPSSNLARANDEVTDGHGLGDYDDILALTVRSESDPFSGRGLSVDVATGNLIEGTIKADVAEVIWYAVENPIDPFSELGEPGMRTVYRRTLLIAPWIGPITQADLATPMSNFADPSEFFRRFDISARFDNSTVPPQWIPNTLSDLAKRENRFAHYVDNSADLGFPHVLLRDAIFPNAGTPAFPTVGATSPLHPFGEPFETLVGPNDPDRIGEDVMLNNVLAFDLRVFDPGAPLYMQPTTEEILEPSDAGWEQTYTTSVNEPGDNMFNDMIGQGAYVDLGYVEVTGITSIPPNPAPPSLQPVRPQFDGVPDSKSMLNFSGATNASVAYDTWSFHYENDGIDQDGDGITDEGTNGLDDDSNNGTDDSNERETSPPYNVPLRGIQVKLRIYEPDSRQIREVTVTRNLVPN